LRYLEVKSASGRPRNSPSPLPKRMPAARATQTPFISTMPSPHATPLPADSTRVNVLSTNEVNYWCHTLNCTETRLRNAVLAVGSLAADVREYLNR
jgi:hypothetical protein